MQVTLDTGIFPSASANPANEFATLRDRVPVNYRKGARHNWHQRRRHAAVHSMLQGLSGRVLDYGCGYGDQAFAMSQRGFEVCGVDLDAERVAFAQQEYAPLEFKQCLPDDAPYGDASFDIVTSIVVLNFIPDAAVHLRSIRRLLKPGGHLLLACKNVNAVRSAVRSIAGRGPTPSKLWMRPKEEVRRLLRAHDFTIVKNSHFYDPPFIGWKNAGDYLFGSVEQLLWLARVPCAAGYFLMLARSPA